MNHLKCDFLKCGSFPPHPPIALSVVSMEVFAPHKMAEIRPRHSNEGMQDPKISRGPGQVHTNVSVGYISKRMLFFNQID